MSKKSRKKKQRVKVKSKGKKEDVMTEMSKELAEKVARAQEMTEPIGKDYYTEEEKIILEKIYHEEEAARRQRAKERVMAAIESGILEDQRGEYMFACHRGSAGDELVVCPSVGDDWWDVLDIIASAAASAIRGFIYDPEKDSFDEKLGEEMLDWFMEVFPGYVYAGGSLIRAVPTIKPV